MRGGRPPGKKCAHDPNPAEADLTAGAGGFAGVFEAAACENDGATQPGTPKAWAPIAVVDNAKTAAAKRIIVRSVAGADGPLPTSFEIEGSVMVVFDV